MGFKEDFLKMKPGPARESFLFNEIVKRGPPKNLVPVTVPGPEGTKITYMVMSNYINIDGIYIPLSGQTAQLVANYFGMKLPTPKMSKQIYNAADTKIVAPPLSAGATINGKYYSGKEVINSGIMMSGQASNTFSQSINDQLSKQNKPPTLIGGHMKDIIQPQGDPKLLSFQGYYNANGKATQSGGGSSPHDSEVYSDYSSGTRLVADKIIVTRPDGTKFETTLDKLMTAPNLSKTISDTGKLTSYPVSSTKLPIKEENKPAMIASNVPAKPQSGRVQFLQRIDNFLSQFSGIA